MEQLLNGDPQRSREYTGLNGGTDCSVATLYVSFVSDFFRALPYSTDVISHLLQHTFDIKTFIQPQKYIYCCKHHHSHHHHQIPLKSPALLLFLYSICVYVLIYKKKLAQCLKLQISKTHIAIFCGLTQIWIQEQPTGVGFAAEPQDSFGRRMLWHSGFPRT